MLFAREVNGKEALVASATLKGEFQDKGLSMMYQEYLSEAFGGKDANATQKLFDNLPKLGLVLELLSLSEWKELGLPPNFDTCARDTYPPDAAFATDRTERCICCSAAV